MKFLAAALFCTLASAAGYGIDLGATLESGRLEVQPVIDGPAGKVVTYDIKVTRDGPGKSSSSSQGGTAKIGDDGHARLASSSVNVERGDRYDVTVRVRDGNEIVAEKSAQYP